MTQSLNPVPGGVTPAGLRTETADDRNTAKTAMAFERLLVGELTKSMADPKLVSGDEASSGTRMLLAQMPDILADALSAGGGIGLAASLQPALEGKAR